MIRRRHLPQAGFTLIELLVAVAMTSLISLALGSALRTMAQAETTIGARASEVDEARVTHELLMQTLSHVSAASRDTAQGPVLDFEARATQLQWVGTMPARPGLGGRHFMRLAVEQDERGQNNLVFRYAPWGPGATWPNWDQSPQRVLLHGVKGFEFSGQGLPPPSRVHPVPWPSGWQTGWEPPDRLPQRLRIAYEDGRGVPMQWVIPIFPSVQTDAGLTLVTVGGGRGR